ARSLMTMYGARKPVTAPTNEKSRTQGHFMGENIPRRTRARRPPSLNGRLPRPNGLLRVPMSEREAMFRQMVTEFPDSPMGHFSLGKFLLEEKRWAEAVASLEQAVKLDP